MTLILRLFSYWSPRTQYVLVYMLQQVAYEPRHFLRWLRHLPATTKVMHRQRLVMTKKALALLVVGYGAWAASMLTGIYLITDQMLWLGVMCMLLSPWVSVLMLGLVTLVAQKLVVDPRQAKEVRRAKARLAEMKATRIAVLGSYGKTTMKELLKVVLGEGKQVASTPGNKNVLISHARWVNSSLTGDEDVLVFEYGEATPGDIASLAELSEPTLAVLTGLAPAHLDNYGSLDAIAVDFMDVCKHVGPDWLYLNNESNELVARMDIGRKYDISGVDGWKVVGIKADINGTEFKMSKGSRKISLRTGLLGLHQIGPLAAVVDIADRLGLSEEQIQAGVAKTKPFEHRMSPYRLGSAWVIDDTYNGNIEGAKAGLKFLSQIETAGRKVYVTPGFVEQGEMKERVHEELGIAIAEAAPERVVLMRNSTTEYIQAGMDAAGYDGELIIEGDPLSFYTGLEHFVAAGDVVLMQNDWTDNYQ